MEIAGANLYLDVGTARGLGPTDTLAARRAAGGPPVGTLAVIAATETRSVVGFVGRPFPVTRGDTLILAATRRSAPVVTPPVAGAPAPRPRPAGAGRAAEGATVRGSAALDMVGTRTTTVGLGTDPERADRDFAVPSLRLQLAATGLPGGGRFSLSAKGSQQVGTASLFDRSTVMRVYDVHYEQDLSAVRFMVGRFFSPYERFSGAWDGALVRVGGVRGFGLGVAAGFQPRSGDEGFSTAVPKLSGFAGFRASGGRATWDADLSAHVWRPSDGTVDRTFVGWSQRLRVSGVRLEHTMEFDRSATGGWSMMRLFARAGVPVGSRFEVSAEYWRDRLHWWEAQPDSLVPSRQRASAGITYGSGGTWISGDVTLLLSDSSVDGHSYSGSLRVPFSSGRASFGGAASYWMRKDFSGRNATGLVATPTLSWQLGAAHPSLSYEFFRSSTAGGIATVSHGGMAAVSLPLGQGLQWLMQLRVRYGDNLRSAGLYSSLRVTF